MNSLCLLMRFPLGNLEVRMLARDLATKKKVKVRTKTGLPGEDWYNGFIARNQLSERLASNMKCSRAAVNMASINDILTR